MRHKIGAYIRVSTEEQAQVIEGSLDSQRHRLETFVDLKNVQEANWGQILEVYADEGFSAKDTRRPAFQRLLRDLKAGKINLILVTDLSRLSRNILDFCLLLEDLRKYKGQFLSVKEQFDTTTASGEMMVFNMMNLAQFERKQTAERVSQNFHSRAMRGLLNGGPVILGYDKKEDNPAQYVVNETEASIVREIFRIFLEEGSLARTAKRLTEMAIPRKIGKDREFRLIADGIWSVGALKTLIENRAYIGIREVNKKYKNQDQSTLKAWQQYREAKAAWPAIISTDVFSSAQEVLAAAKRWERPKTLHAKGSPFLLTGLLKCLECGAPFVGETGHGRVSSHRYYAHKKYLGVELKCRVRRFPADIVEDELQKYVGRLAVNPSELQRIEAAIATDLDDQSKDARSERERVSEQLQDIERETGRVFGLLAEMGEGNGLKLVKEQIEKLAQRKKAVQGRLQELDDRLAIQRDTELGMTVLQERIQEFKKGWSKGSLFQKKHLLRNLIERIDVGAGYLGVHYLVPRVEDSKVHDQKIIRPIFGIAREALALDQGSQKAVGMNSVTPTLLGSVVVKNGVTNGT